MSTQTREDHMQWCKDRAFAYCDRGDAINALASFASDINKHPDTASNPTISMLCATIGMRHAMDGDVVALRKFIEDFA